MRGRRGLLAASAAALIVLLVAAMLCLSRVPADSLGLVSRGGHVVRLLAPGLHLRRPFDSLTVVPAGPVDYSGSIRIRTAEGSARQVPFRLSLDLSKARIDGLSPLAAGLATGSSLDHVVAALLEEAASAAPGGDAVAARLAGLGLVPGSLWLGPARAAGDAAPASAGNPLRGVWKAPPWGVLLIGIDSADWDLMTPLIDSGALPHLKELREKGAWGTLRSMKPTLSPILWTTIATGRRPEDHGIIDFLMKDPATGAEVPISRRFRRVKALWNIASDLELPSTTVAWWATWPAERVTGSMVTDRVAYSLFDLPAADQPAGMVYPESLGPEVSKLKVDADSITYEDLRGLLDVPQGVFERARAALGTAEGYRDPVSHLIRVLASTRTYHNIARALVSRQPGGLTLVYYEGLDEVNHRFAHFLAPPLRLTRGTEPALAAAFAQAVPNFYRLQDRLVGELLEAAPTDTIVMVVSDHGFANGAERPVDEPPDIEGKPGLWHTLDGVVIVAGPPVRPGRLDTRVELLDIAPTVLALLGLPAAADMPGRAIAEILRPGAAPVPPAVKVASYDRIGEPPPGAEGPAASPQDAEMIARLAALGYVSSGGSGVSDAGSGSGTATYHVNAGQIFLARNELDRARDEFARARELAPNFDQPLLGLAQVEVMRGRPAESLPYLEQTLKLTPPPQPILLTRAAQVYLKARRQRQGLEFLDGLAMAGRHEAFRLTATGMLHESLGETSAALSAYRRALDLDPSVERALYGAYTLMKKGGDLETLAALLGRSVDVESVPVGVRAANWLALTRELQGRRPEARTILAKALERAPEDLMTLGNLGSMLVRDDRASDGLAYLERAYAIQPKSFEVLVNLIVAHGKLGNLPEARRFFGEAEKGAAARPELYNAIAYACFLNGERTAAEGYLARSLAMAPDQKEAKRLKQELDRGGG